MSKIDLEKIAKEQPHTEVGKLLSTKKGMSLVEKEMKIMEDEIKLQEKISSILDTHKSGEKVYCELLSIKTLSLAKQLKLARSVALMKFPQSQNVTKEEAVSLIFNILK